MVVNWLVFTISVGFATFNLRLMDANGDEVSIARAISMGEGFRRRHCSRV